MFILWILSTFGKYFGYYPIVIFMSKFIIQVRSMQPQEGWITYLTRGIFTIGFWGAFAIILFGIIINISQAPTSIIKNTIKNFFSQIRRFFKTLLRSLKYILKKQYQIKDQDFSDINSIPKIIMLVIVIIFQQIIQTILSIVATLTELIKYFKINQPKISFQDKILQKFICPISGKIIIQPIIISQCGHTFDRTSLQTDFRDIRGFWGVNLCHICKRTYRNKHIIKNFLLSNLLIKLKQQISKTEIKIKNKKPSQFKEIIKKILFYTSPLYSSSTKSSETQKDSILEKYNILNEKLLTLEKYRKDTDKFVKLLNFQQSGKKLFIFINNKTYSFKINANITKIDNYQTQLNISANGNKVSWVSKGYFLHEKNALYFRMEIKDIVIKYPTQKYGDLLLVSDLFQTPITSISGKCYLVKQKVDPLENLEYGEWKLLNKEQSLKTSAKNKQNKKQIKQKVLSQKQIKIGL